MEHRRRRSWSPRWQMHLPAAAATAHQHEWTALVRHGEVRRGEERSDEESGATGHNDSQEHWTADDDEGRSRPAHSDSAAPLSRRWEPRVLLSDQFATPHLRCGLWRWIVA